MNWIFLFIAIVAEVTATSALKAADSFRNFLPSLVVVVGYSVAFFFLSLTLKNIPVGVAYAIWSGVGIALISLIGFIWYKQTLNYPTILGIIFIIIGIIIINIYSKNIIH